MNVNEIIAALRRMKVETGSLVCFGCGHEHNCGTCGCAILREAADTIERLNDFDQSQSLKMLVKLQHAQAELDEMKRSGWISVDDRLDWLDPEIEVPPDDGAVLGIVNGVINGIEHQNAVSLVCYDRGEWWMFDKPDIDVKVDWWMPLPEPPVGSMSVKNNKYDRVWLIAKRLMAAVLVILGATALIHGETMEVSPTLWAVAAWCAAALIMTARE